MEIFFLAILAGFLTILAPCILPLLPFLLGTGNGRSHWRPLGIVLGFVGTFSVVGAALAVFGSFLGISNQALRYVAVGFLVLFGLALLFEGVYDRLMAKAQPLFARLGTRVAGGAVSKKDALSGLLVGASLGLIWTPCAGPILGAIIALANRSDDYWVILFLLFAYALGAGVPMLAIAYGGNALQRKLVGLGRWQRILNRVFGLLIIAMAVLILTGYDLVLQSKLIEYYPASYRSKL